MQRTGSFQVVTLSVYATRQTRTLQYPRIQVQASSDTQEGRAPDPMLVRASIVCLSVLRGVSVCVCVRVCAPCTHTHHAPGVSASCAGGPRPERCSPHEKAVTLCIRGVCRLLFFTTQTGPPMPNWHPLCACSF
jgi:hypothetical protein